MTVEKVSSHSVGTTGQIREKGTVERPHGTGSPTAPAAEGIQEDVQISSQAKGITRLMDLVKQLPDSLSPRVDELKRQISKGTYEVPAIEIAKKMLGEGQ